MSVSEAREARSGQGAASTIFARCYRLFGYFGLMTVLAALLYGFSYDQADPWWHYPFNIGLYLVFVVPHLVMTRSWLKQRAWGNPAGSLRERQVYIFVSVIMWGGLLWLHRGVPGPALSVVLPIRFAGYVGFLWSLLLFFEGATRASLDGLIGVPGTEMQYSHGHETPLYTEGPYAEVRHPMYRAIMLMGICALAVHPNAAQLFWTAMVGATFLAFIPIEEAQLLAARGDDYRRYRQQTPYRLFRGIW